MGEATRERGEVRNRAMICPYCGDEQPRGAACGSCRGRVDAASRQATHAQMGPWFVRDAARPFAPGCSLETLARLVERGVVTRSTVVRGPGSQQFWMRAERVAGISHWFGVCHACAGAVAPGSAACPACGAGQLASVDRQWLGLHAGAGTAGAAGAAPVGAVGAVGTDAGASAAGAADDDAQSAKRRAWRAEEALSRARAQRTFLVCVVVGLGLGLAASVAGVLPRVPWGGASVAATPVIEAPAADLSNAGAMAGSDAAVMDKAMVDPMVGGAMPDAETVADAGAVAADETGEAEEGGAGEGAEAPAGPVLSPWAEAAVSGDVARVREVVAALEAKEALEGLTEEERGVLAFAKGRVREMELRTMPVGARDGTP